VTRLFAPARGRGLKRLKQTMSILERDYDGKIIGLWLGPDYFLMTGLALHVWWERGVFGVHLMRWGRSIFDVRIP